ncbi:stage V sporulation protein K-like [Salvia hispanica]|uniref:stage V sporulation protein K-like n=1 Tax=Salvia hispanica TaxID=49212 RepID=UPI00200962D8|nr:stage V sporulation protein K-like [Salvia hispanica]
MEDLAINTSHKTNGGYGQPKGPMDELEIELSKIIGLDEVKAHLRKLGKGMLLDKNRRAMGVNLSHKNLPHMAFLGNPGTGKTTVARILCKLLSSVGVLFRANVFQVEPTDLVSKYYDETRQKTVKKIQDTRGKILFIDDAHCLSPSDTSGSYITYGEEALDEIMSAVEEGRVLVIFAGCTKPMKDAFSLNKGFCERVEHFFQFDDYSCRELAEMLMLKVSKPDERSRLFGFKLGSCCSVDAVASLIERKTSEKMRSKMNGRLVDHMLNNGRDHLDSRLGSEAKGDELLTITLADLEAGLDQLVRRLNVG